MYDFAIVALLALAAIKVADFVCENVPAIDRFRTLITFVLTVGSVVWLDYSLFDAWGAQIRNDTLGVWITGFVAAGLTVPWRAAFRWLTHDRATGDESLGEHTRMLRKVS